MIEQRETYLYWLTEGLESKEFTVVPREFSETIPSDCLLTEFGIELREVGRGRAYAAMAVSRQHLNQRGIAQAGAVVALADATAGWASYSALKHGRFTTLNLDTKLVRPAHEGDTILAIASPIHLGRTTQVFDVGLNEASSSKLIAQFTCTQLVMSAP